MASSIAVTAFTAHDRRVLTAVNAGAASLSLAGSSFIVLCYLFFKELRKFSFKLVFYLALSDMLCSFFSIIGDPSKGFFCYAQGYSTHFFCVASFLWTTTIAFTLHRTVVKHKTDVEDLEAMFHLYVWGTSLVMTVARSFGNDHRHFGAWCWSQTGRTRKASSSRSTGVHMYFLQVSSPPSSGNCINCNAVAEQFSSLLLKSTDVIVTLNIILIGFFLYKKKIWKFSFITVGGGKLCAFVMTIYHCF